MLDDFAHIAKRLEIAVTGGQSPVGDDCAENAGMGIQLNWDEVHSAPLASATVMLLRDARDGVQVLMMRRHGDSQVLGGAHVFPGGKLDPADRLADASILEQSPQQLQQALGQFDLDAPSAAALYVAALRETFEECGLLLCQGVSAPVVQQVREQLDAGESFFATVQRLGLQMQSSQVVPWSRWITPRVPTVSNKRFDTRFFAALAPTEQEARHDEHEATELVWLSPRQALEHYWQRQIELAPPQIMTLAHLARFERVTDLLERACSTPPALIEPQPFELEGERAVCYPGDAHHSVAEPAWPGPTRLIYRNQRFEPEGGLAALLA